MNETENNTEKTVNKSAAQKKPFPAQFKKLDHWYVPVILLCIIILWQNFSPSPYLFSGSYSGAAAAVGGLDDGSSAASVTQNATRMEAASMPMLKSAASSGTADIGSLGTDTVTAAPDESTAAVQDTRKLVKTSEATIETKKYDDTLEKIKSEVKEANGYIEDINTRTGNGGTSRSASVTVRVPADKYDEYMSWINNEDSFSVPSMHENTSDITLQYNNNESRIETLNTEHDRLLKLMDGATDINAVVALETRLTQVESELNQLNTSKKTMDDQVSYAKVILTVNEVVEYSPEENSHKESLLERIIISIENSLDTTADFWQDLIVMAVWFFPVAVQIAVIILVVKYIRKRKAAKKDKMKKQ